MADDDDDAVTAAWHRCRARRPDIEVPLPRFRAHLAGLRGPTATVEAQLAGCVDDLYLACACTGGDAAALRAAERELLPAIDAALSTWHPQVAADTREQLRAALFIDHDGRGPLLARYAGRGTLRRWVRVVAAREAGKLRRASHAHRLVDDHAMFDALVTPGDPQLSAIKREAAAAFRIAFAAALAELTPRERTVLRLHLLDGMTIDDIAPLYDVHRATAARWVGAAASALFDRTRRRLMHDLRIGADEVDSLLRLIHSRIELPAGALATPPAP